MWKDSFEEMKRFRREMNRLFDAVLGSEFAERALPDISSVRKDMQLFKLIASIEIPGIDKKDIQLQITENKKGYLRAERSYKGFYRSISLPTKVLPEQAKASYRDGVLGVVMPKVEKKKLEKAKKVEVQ